MIWQQNKMMPPPTDEQMAQQQRMMKIMMIMVAVMFYKVAAGLALYFIIGTTWGLIERRFIPKADDKKPDQGGAGETADLNPKSGSPNGHPTSVGTVQLPKSKGLLGRLARRSRSGWRRCRGRPTSTRSDRFATRRAEARMTVKTRPVARMNAAIGRRSAAGKANLGSCASRRDPAPARGFATRISRRGIPCGTKRISRRSLSRVSLVRTGSRPCPCPLRRRASCSGRLCPCTS